MDDDNSGLETTEGGRDDNLERDTYTPRHTRFNIVTTYLHVQEHDAHRHRASAIGDGARSTEDTLSVVSRADPAPNLHYAAGSARARSCEVELEGVEPL